ncbi:NAD(P)/FAD-dependent oxidoreductase [Segetibacter koreensis]|uniref:NAD(P)/FAD-dependent oxidoreductase n=1 Tax=Segetibacter koreensis TaxID=398037 RepID=UPI00039F4B3F|nr:NAD(P)/FAD-dependent oxidoreductase [Segetibacter koreensis]
MQQQISVKVLPSEAANENIVIQYIAKATGKKITDVTGYNLLKSSIDARGIQPFINLSVKAFINEPFVEREVKKVEFTDVKKANRKVIIIGAGPAGLFAALKLIEKGIQPIILERGKDVRARRRDLAALNKEGIINEDSNYCFGEGGAGTYSDGKLYTRSSKRGDINRILNLFVQFGADEKILYESHPHIGTNKLPNIVTAIRECIIAYGGQFLFNKKVVDFDIKNNSIQRVITSDGHAFEGESFILATGHSARDIFTLLFHKNILIEPKPFALGVRIEHPQSIIDSIQYHCSSRDEFLPPASYSLVQQVEDKGVFSFCMCPGGIIAPASTKAEELVVNGWSPSKRNNPFANSGIVVTCQAKDVADVKDYKDYMNEKKTTINSPLSMMHFQEMVEKKAYKAGGGKFVAPAQRLVDFCNNKLSASLPLCSYLPGISSNDLRSTLPPFIYHSLQEGFKSFGKKMKGYFTNEAVVVATESRTSSPVRIPRDEISLQHPQVKNLYPCGEGAGYAGGIVSAAMDGERVAAIIAVKQ